MLVDICGVLHTGPHAVAMNMGKALVPAHTVVTDTSNEQFNR